MSLALLSNSLGYANDHLQAKRGNHTEPMTTTLATNTRVYTMDRHHQISPRHLLAA